VLSRHWANLQRHEDLKDQMISVAQHLETSALDFFDPMVGFHKGMLVRFNQKLFTCSVSRVCGCKFYFSRTLCSDLKSVIIGLILSLIDEADILSFRHWHHAG